MEDACSVTVTGESIEVGGASLLSAGTVSRFLHTVALTPPDTTLAKCDGRIFFYFMTPHFTQAISLINISIHIDQ